MLQFFNKKGYRFTSIHALSVALRESLLKDRRTPVISEESLEAIHRGVEKFLQEIRKCIDRNTIQNVIIYDYTGYSQLTVKHVVIE